MLSHYTSERGFIGIVRSQSLRATEFLSLNDQSEYIHAFREIQSAALDVVIEKIPAELRDSTKGDSFFRTLPATLGDELKTQVRAGDGYGSLYICSFARGRNDDENNRGILTLWDRYTRNEGYCLQFDEANVRRVIEHENTRNSYFWIDLAEVQYGVDRATAEFQYLATQLAHRLMQRIYQETRDRRVAEHVGQMDPEATFARKLMSLCGTHKDPSFSDEREMRILAYPANVSEARIFTGIASPKIIYRVDRKPDGARYIMLGENTLPGFIPDRIVAGPKSETPVHMLRALYPFQPSFSKSTIPIR